ncbi:hypothetical protein EV193_101227 [Herbihabitans rhizosphaerae]|uniref:Uncharacterized protein n=1 Tax=Herbihabitans rhizosphaerae TaxID=1872711 RepID=A0A4Q7L7L4_9PSEU|nr:hypothetical protein [Herbihabitans rhizosphaerae]RZS44352.1 hypothetical protein EV193_101227 [Herbihabitans rhizosphaerae]
MDTIWKAGLVACALMAVPLVVVAVSVIAERLAERRRIRRCLDADRAAELQASQPLSGCPRAAGAPPPTPAAAHGELPTAV